MIKIILEGKFCSFCPTFKIVFFFKYGSHHISRKLENWVSEEFAERACALV